MKIHKKINVFDMAFRLEQQLRAEGVSFNEFGYPDFRRVSFPKEIPPECAMFPLTKRHQANDRKHTILCSFENDPSLYARLHDLNGLITEIARDYYGVCGFDLSVCVNMPLSEQRAYLLLNMLITGYMVAKGLRVIPNWRTGTGETSVALRSYPTGICFAAGTLGCSQSSVGHGRLSVARNVALTNPSCLLIYGPIRKEYKEILDERNVRYRVYPDFRTESYAGKYKMRKVA